MASQSLGNTKHTPEASGIVFSTIYGPVKSWRLGRSLGVDLLYRDSICSFRCVYCQLGKIQTPTMERKVYVASAQVLADLAASKWQDADVVTFSGNGEPTLALNLGEVLEAVKGFTGKPTAVLSNGTLLGDPEVRADLARADRVFVKLDAATDKTLRMVDNPVEGITVAGIVAGAKAFRAEYKGLLAIQTMIMPMNVHEVDALCDLFVAIHPDEVQLNTPLRPVPRAWYPESRGNHEGPSLVPETHLKVLTRQQASAIEQRVRERTGLSVVSVYQPG